MLQNCVLTVLFLAVSGTLILVIKLVTKTMQMQIPDREQATSHEFEIDPVIGLVSDAAKVDSDEAAVGDPCARNYIIVVLGIVLLAQMIFLVPWAVKAKTLGIFGVIEMVLFLAAVIVGYVWLWKKGAIEWA